MPQAIESDDPYIRLLIDAKEDLKDPKGISYQDFLKRVSKYHVKQHPERLYQAIYDPVLIGQGEYHIGLEAYFKLLDYQELKLALENAEQAKRQARLAIWVTAVVGVFQIILTVVQIFK